MKIETEKKEKYMKSTEPKKTPRLLRVFAQSRVMAEKQSESKHVVPGMSQYSDDVGAENFVDADQDVAPIPQRCEFFEFSPQ